MENVIMKKTSTSLRFGILLSIAFVLNACASGGINVEHSALQSIPTVTPFANLYILRPTLLKLKGASRGVLQVSFDGVKIMDLGAGEYTLIKIRPGQARVATHSLSKFTNKRDPIKVSRYRDYNFIADATYFIHISRVNEEFRGVFFDPKPIILSKAKTYLHNLSPFGLAKDAPIESLSNIAIPTAPGELPIVVPEKLYPGEKYILTPKPFK